MNSAGSTTTIRLSGDYDVITAPSITEQVGAALAGGASTVVIDLGSVVFMDSTAIGALISARNDAEINGSALKLVNVPANTHRLLTLTALDKVFDIEAAQPEDEDDDD